MRTISGAFLLTWLGFIGLFVMIFSGSSVDNFDGIRFEKAVLLITLILGWMYLCFLGGWLIWGSR